MKPRITMITLARNVGLRAEVDAAMAEAHGAGAAIVKPAWHEGEQ